MCTTRPDRSRKPRDDRASFAGPALCWLKFLSFPFLLPLPPRARTVAQLDERHRAFPPRSRAAVREFITEIRAAVKLTSVASRSRENSRSIRTLSEPAPSSRARVHATPARDRKEKRKKKERNSPRLSRTSGDQRPAEGEGDGSGPVLRPVTRSSRRKRAREVARERSGIPGNSSPRLVVPAIAHKPRVARDAQTGLARSAVGDDDKENAHCASRRIRPDEGTWLTLERMHLSRRGSRPKSRLGQDRSRMAPRSHV